MNNIKFFKNLKKEDTKIVGGKGSSLGEMYSSNIPVPNGFVILSSTFNFFLKENNLDKKIKIILKKVNLKETITFSKASKEIQSLILAYSFSEKLSKEILSSFKILNSNFVAVRSSATAEDSKKNAWAGQLDTFLFITEKNLLESVKKCFASLFTERAIFYRFNNNLEKQNISVAVVVQKMVFSEVSGIAFSVHPVEEDYDKIIIEAGYGLGEAIVSGKITPDSYVVSKKNLEILDKNISSQEKGIYRCLRKGTKWKNIDKKKSSLQKLSDKDIKNLSKIIIAIENHYGFPVDVEWALENKKLFITQARPITTLKKKKYARQ